MLDASIIKPLILGNAAEKISIEFVAQSNPLSNVIVSPGTATVNGCLCNETVHHPL